MEEVGAYLAREAHVPAGTYVRQLLLSKVAEAQHRSQA
jgi:hypothetical protein